MPGALNIPPSVLSMNIMIYDYKNREILQHAIAIAGGNIPGPAETGGSDGTSIFYIKFTT